MKELGNGIRNTIEVRCYANNGYNQKTTMTSK